MNPANYLNTLQPFMHNMTVKIPLTPNYSHGHESFPAAAVVTIVPHKQKETNATVSILECWHSDK